MSPKKCLLAIDEEEVRTARMHSCNCEAACGAAPRALPCLRTRNCWQRRSPMVGPVVYMEMVLGSRRGRQYIFRWIYAAWLVLQLLYFYWNYWINTIFATPALFPTAVVSEHFVETFLFQQLILMVLATPAFAAGAITDEKNRGTLQYLLTADLSAWHIVVGKLLGRTSQVAVLALTGLPMLCFFGVFGGLEPLSLMAALLVAVIPLFALGSATMLASVWSKQTRDAVL